MTPPTCDTNPWIRTYKICIMRTAGFVSQARGGLPPPSCDTKPRFCVAIMPLDQKVGFRHLRHARSSRLVKSASFDETKRLGEVRTQNEGSGNYLFHCLSMRLPETRSYGKANHTSTPTEGQAGLWTKKLDFDTYAMPGALVWADLHCLMRLRVWEGSGPKIEGSGTKN